MWRRYKPIGVSVGISWNLNKEDKTVPPMASSYLVDLLSHLLMSLLRVLTNAICEICVPFFSTFQIGTQCVPNWAGLIIAYCSEWIAPKPVISICKRPPVKTGALDCWMGKGFAFVARQQRISKETQEFYIDLLFYSSVGRVTLALTRPTNYKLKIIIYRLGLFITGRTFTGSNLKAGKSILS